MPDKPKKEEFNKEKIDQRASLYPEGETDTPAYTRPPEREDFWKGSEPPPAAPKAPEPAKPATTAPVAPAAASPETVKPEAPKAPEAVPAPEIGGKKEEVKTVPLDALHQARKELQEAKKENAGLREQVNVLLADLKEYVQKAKAEGDPVKPVGDYDAELTKLQKEVEDLRKKDSARETASQEERARATQVEFNASLDKVNVELEKEGFPGFRRFKSLVTDELNELAKADREHALALDRPDGWKQLYKEKVFPQVKALFTQQEIAEKTATKEALKDGASLIPPTAPPASPAKKDEDEPLTFEKYVEIRRKRSLQTQ